MGAFEQWLYNQAPTVVVLVLLAWALVVRGLLATSRHLDDLKGAHADTLAQMEKRIEAAERNAAMWQELARPAVMTAQRAVEVAAGAPPQKSA